MKNFFLHELLKKNHIKFDPKIKNIKISNLSSLNTAQNGSLTFFSNIKHFKSLINCMASVFLVSKKLEKNIPVNKIKIISKNPELDFYKILNFIESESYYSKISYKKLSIKDIKNKYKNLSYGNNFYVEKDVKIGKKVFIGNNVTIKKNCEIGSNVVIGSNVIIENSIIGDNVHICDGSVIGKKGFGFKFINNELLRIPHVGKVIIEDGCEIGANCVIDRGSLNNTVIGSETFLDNLIHIAHNVIIGKRCIIAAQVGIAGSSKIGNFVVIGGQAGISGHLVIGNNVKIGGKSGVLKNLEDNEVVMGYPAKSIREFIKGQK